MTLFSRLRRLTRSSKPEAENSERAARLRAEVAKIPFWYHCLDLGDGVVTPGCAATKWGQTGNSIGMPRSLTGKSVLDVGAWDGFYSFEAERRGASRVLATDSYAWTTYQENGKAGFELARSVLGSRPTLTCSRSTAPRWPSIQGPSLTMIPRAGAVRIRPWCTQCSNLWVSV